MKVGIRCEHREGEAQCPNSAGFRTMKPHELGGWQLLPGHFCGTHVGKHGERKITLRKARLLGAR